MNWRRLRTHPLWHAAVAIALLVVLQLFVVKLFGVSSQSMEPGLRPGDRVVVNRLAYLRDGPAFGDLVVFTADSDWDASSEKQAVPTARRWVRGVLGVVGIGSGNQHYLVKRVIGVAGDTVSCCTFDGLVQRNGTAIREDYVRDDLEFVPGALDCSTTPASLRCFPAVTVPEDKILVLGDHRSMSKDGISDCRAVEAQASSCARWVDKSNVVGRVWWVVWPLGRDQPK